MSSSEKNDNNGNVRVMIIFLVVALVAICFAIILKPKEEPGPAATISTVAGEAAVTTGKEALQTPDEPDDFEMGAGAGKIDPPPMAPLNDGESIDATSASVANEVADDDAAIGITAADPYDIYLVDENWMKTYGGFCVERNGKLYALCQEMPTTVCTVFNCGYQIGDGGFKEDGCSYLNLYDQREISDVPTQATDALVSIGDFPIFYLEPGEELRMYSSQPVEKVSMKQAQFYGYTIPATGRQVTYFPIIDFEYAGLNGNITRPAVLTPDGNPVEDVRQLEHGKEYMFEWYEGMEYHSKTFAADSRCYIVDDDDLAFFVPVNMTKNGYGIVDLSEVEPGGNTYTINGLPFELR